MVVATKPTSALPVVGAVSAADPHRHRLPARRLGGRRRRRRCSPLFIFGVALAGTRTTKDRLDQRRAKGLAPTMEPTEPAPTVVADAIARIEELAGDHRRTGS